VPAWLTFLLLTLALLCFLGATVNTTVGTDRRKVNLLALGLAFWVLTLVVKAWPA
jgi:hypothetical protein